MTTTSAPSAALPPGAWRADLASSTAAFAVRRPLLPPLRGRVEVLDARLDTTDGRAALTGTAAVGSLVVRPAHLAPQARSAELLDAERFPLVAFRSTSIRRAGRRLEVHGDLTVRGLTRPVRAVGLVVGPDEHARVTIALEAVVDRREFGLAWAPPGAADAPALVDDVTLTVHLELTRA